jgi:hypothetical protein
MPGALDVIEVFDWEGVLASWDVLRGWRGAGGSDDCLGNPENVAADARSV